MFRALVYLCFFHGWTVQVIGRNVQRMEDADFYGLHRLVDPVDAILDIVAVHGLDGNWEDSWYHREADVFRLLDLLPDVLPQARIYSFSYNAQPGAREAPITLGMYEHAQSLVTHLELERERTHTQRRPIIFLCHGLGGIVVKSALHYSDKARPGHLESKISIKLSTDAVIFIGTPHQGGEGTSLAQVISQAIASVPSIYANRKLLQNLERHSSWLQTLQAHFNLISTDFRIICFYEQLRTLTPFGRVLVVPRHSAVIQGAAVMDSEGLLADHDTLTKYEGIHDPNFLKVSNRLIALAMDSEDRVRQRWERSDASQDTLNQRPSGILGTVRQPQVMQEFSLGVSFAYKQNPHFTGREDEIDSIVRVLKEPATHHHLKSVVLTGSSGVGKTQIALEYAHRHQETYASTFWIDGSSESAAVSSITSILKKIQVHYEMHGLDIDNPRYDFIEKAVRESSPWHERRKGCDMTPIEAFIRWLSLRRNRSWLLIVDNVDDLEGWDVGSVLPNTHWGAIIITSRSSDLALYGDAIQVDEMDETEAMSLFSLTSRIALNEDPADIHNTRKLVRRVSHLPLAIVQAGSYVFQHQIPVADYLLLLSSYPRNILSEPPIAPWEEETYSLIATWDISYKAIIARDPLAARILMACAYLSPHDISLPIFKEGMKNLGSGQVQDSVQLLQSYSLVGASAIDSSDTAIGLHPSVRLWAKYRLDARSRSELARETLVMVHEIHSLYGHEFKEWMKWTFRLGPHVARLMYSYRDEVSPCGTLPVDLISADSRVFDQGSLGKMTEAQNHVSQQVSRSGQAETHFPTWKLLNNLRYIIGDEDRLKLLEWVVCETQRLHSLSHPVVLDLLGDYANTLQNSHHLRDDAAYACFKWLLEARIKILGLNHPGTSDAMLGLGRASSDCSEKMRLLTEAASLRMKNLGREDPRTMDTINALSKGLCSCRQCLAVGDCTGGYAASTLMLEWLFPEYHGRPPWESRPGTFAESVDKIFQLSAEKTLDLFADCDGLLLADLTRQLAINAEVDAGWALMRPFFKFTTTGQTSSDMWFTAWKIGGDVAFSWVIKNVERISHSPTLLRQVISTIEEGYINGLDAPFWTQDGSACLLSQYAFSLWLLYLAEGDHATANIWFDTAIFPRREQSGPGSEFADPWAFGGNCVNHDEFDGRFPECPKPPSKTNMPPPAPFITTPRKPPRLVFADLLGRVFNSLPVRSSGHDSSAQELDYPVECDISVGYSLVDPVITTKSLMRTHAAEWLVLTENSWYGCQGTQSQEATVHILRNLDLENSFGLRRDIWESLRHFHHDAEDTSTSCFSDIRLWQMCREPELSTKVKLSVGGSSPTTSDAQNT